MSADGETSPPDGLSRGRELPMPRLQAEGADLLRGAGSEPAARPGEDQGVLASAAALRFPDLRGFEGARKIDALVDHINDTAILRGQLEELRLEAHLRAYQARERLRGVPAGVGKSKAATEELRRAAAPDVAVELDGALWLIDRCTEQINRLGGSDYDAASRVYTLLS